MKPVLWMLGTLLVCGCVTQTTAVPGTVVSVPVPPLDCTFQVSGANLDYVPDFPGHKTPDEAIDHFISSMIRAGERIITLGDYQVQFLGAEGVDWGSGVAQVFLVVAEDGRQAMHARVTSAPGDLEGWVVSGGGWCCPDSGCE